MQVMGCGYVIFLFDAGHGLWLCNIDALMQVMGCGYVIFLFDAGHGLWLCNISV